MELQNIHIIQREDKPRLKGITLIPDHGLSIQNLRSFISSAGHLIDYVKIYPGAFFSGEDLKAKIDIYKYAEIIPVLSGILFEYSYIRNNIKGYKDFLKMTGIEYIEVSDSIVDIGPEEKAQIIREFSKTSRVFSKVGSELNKIVFPRYKWKEYLEKEALSHKIIIEGKGTGITQFMSGTPELKKELIQHITQYADIEKLIWEAPSPKHQAGFIEIFDVDVNLAEIQINKVLELEALRTGLRPETFEQSLPEFADKKRIRKLDPMQNIDYQI